MSHIVDDIYIGDIDNAIDKVFITKNKIKHIVSVSDINNMEQSVCREIGTSLYTQLKHHVFWMTDYIDSTFKHTLLNQICDLITIAVDKNNPILVHCMAGMSRSPTCVIYYLMKKKAYSYTEALNFVTDIRDCVNLNPSFDTQLKEYDQHRQFD